MVPLPPAIVRLMPTDPAPCDIWRVSIDSLDGDTTVLITICRTHRPPPQAIIVAT